MAEVIIFPDVEALLVPHLRAELAARDWDVPVGTRVPNPRPTTAFVRLFVTGGSLRDLAVDRPSVTVESWAEREADAYELAALCRGIIHAVDVIDGVQFYRVESMSRPQNLPDPVTSQVRYTATYSLSYRGAAV